MGWSPWAELRERGHVTLEWRDLPANVRGAWIPTAAGAVIVLSTALQRRERRCVLAHELVHDERGLSYDAGTPIGLVVKEEAAVDREVARRLVPLTELAALVRARAEVEPITAELVADEFDVTTEVARRALRDLLALQR